MQTMIEDIAKNLFCKYYNFNKINEIKIQDILSARRIRFTEEYWEVWKNYGVFFAFVEGFFHVMNGENQLSKIPNNEKYIFQNPRNILKNFKSSVDLVNYLRKYNIKRMVNIHARNILLASQKMINEFDGKVPQNLNDLMKFNGYGRKLSNMLLNLAFDIPRIAVDVRVFRAACNLHLLPAELCIKHPSSKQLFKAESILNTYFVNSIYYIEMDFLLFKEGG